MRVAMNIMQAMSVRYSKSHVSTETTYNLQVLVKIKRNSLRTGTQKLNIQPTAHGFTSNLFIANIKRPCTTITVVCEVRSEAITIKLTSVLTT